VTRPEPGMNNAAIYLAARYARRDELCRYRDELEARGFTVTSRWLAGPDQVGATGTVIGTAAEQLIEAGDPAAGILRAACALADMEDIAAADILIAFTEDPAFYSPGSSRGGRHVELGLALARPGMRVIICGPRENQFCWIAFRVEQHDTWRELRRAIDAELTGVQ
jgi:hypothetical protein